MKKIIPVVFLFAASCNLEALLDQIRPNASWVVHYEKYDGLEWFDKNQDKPTEQELIQADSDCQAQAISPSLEDRVKALETAVTAVAVKTDTAIELPVVKVSP